MKRTLTALAAAVLLCAAPMAAQEMTLEQILDKHYEAIGGLDAWSAVTTAKMTGKMSAPQGFEAPFTIMFKVPGKSRLEFTFQGMTGVQAVDGDTAWQYLSQSWREEEAYMLLSIVGELRIGTSPRPIMAARLIVPRETLKAAGWPGAFAAA